MSPSLFLRLLRLSQWHFRVAQGRREGGEGERIEKGIRKEGQYRDAKEGGVDQSERRTALLASETKAVR